MNNNEIIIAAIGAFATICSAGLGAFATVVVALISKLYVSRRLSSLQGVLKSDPLVYFLLNLFGVFRIQEACIFEIYENSTFTDTETEITIAVYAIILDDHVDFVYHLPQQTEPFVVQNARVGWRKLFHYERNTYALQLTEINALARKVDFDFRKVTKNIYPVQ